MRVEGAEPRWKRRAVIAASGGAVVAGAGVRMGLAEASSSVNDAALLNSALVLEELQAAFYAKALGMGKLRGDLAQFARVVGAHEQDHVAFIRHLLGQKARQVPAFEFGAAVASPRRFAETARLLEDLGVAAYDGQAPGLSRSVLAAVAK